MSALSDWADKHGEIERVLELREQQRKLNKEQSMSRLYRMDISVRGFAPDRAGAIEQALDRVWNIECSERDEGPDVPEIKATGEGNLCGGETEEHFFDRLCFVVWDANGQYCQVSADCRCLENLPFSTYKSKKADYQPRFKVAEHFNGFSIADTKTGKTHWLSDGVDAVPGMNPGDEGFCEAWAQQFNANVAETIECYWPEETEQEQSK